MFTQARAADLLPPARRRPQWPDDLLDLESLYAQGWRPSPFRDYVLKVHQRCNLACDYCYVYELADQSWRDRPAVITPEVWRAAARRIDEHVRAHRLDQVRVILHGGEPLLAGRDLLRTLVADVRAALPAACRVDFGLQTNGLLLDEATLAALHGQGIAVGVSIDGAPADHDRHRRTVNGRGSSAGVHRALGLLTDPRYRSAYAGLLCTVDPSTDPIGCYEALIGYAPPAVDFLLPHANWQDTPARYGTGTPYGDWLVAIFDRWYGAPRQETRVRLFEEIVNLVLGGQSRTEQVGLAPVAVAVIETDGSVEQVDSLKSAYAGACATGVTVFTDTLDTALRHPGVAARQIGVAALSEQCLSCPVHQICGGGHYAHRYRPDNGFRNPSVYCADLLRVIRHVRSRVAADLERLGPA